MEEVIQKDLLQEFVADLEQKVSSSSIKPDDFKKALYQLKEAKFKIQGLLDLLQDNDGEMKKLYRSVANENYADLIDDLNSLGYRHRKQNEGIKDAFEKMGYRIMEQTRAGKRDDVFYSFLRIYMSVNVPFDRKLLFAFKHPNNEMFKVLIFSFLSGIIEEKTNNKE
jgi:hypothetical protein